MKMMLATSRKGVVTGIFFVDAEDSEVISKHRWRLNNCGYAFTTVNGSTQSAHRLVMGEFSAEMQVDHIDGNVWNNCKGNLRLATNSQNTVNRHVVRSKSGFRGVTFHRGAGKWQAQTKVLGKNKHLGLYETKEDAAVAYDEAAKKYFGEFAICNFGEAA